MKERLFIKGLATTLIGLSIIGFSALVLWEGLATAEALSGWIALALVFLRSKDSLIGLPVDEKK